MTEPYPSGAVRQNRFDYFFNEYPGRQQRYKGARRMIAYADDKASHPPSTHSGRNAFLLAWALDDQGFKTQYDRFLQLSLLIEKSVRVGLPALIDERRQHEIEGAIPGDEFWKGKFTSDHTRLEVTKPRRSAMLARLSMKALVTKHFINTGYQEAVSGNPDEINQLIDIELARVISAVPENEKEALDKPAKYRPRITFTGATITADDLQCYLERLRESGSNEDISENAA